MLIIHKLIVQVH